MKREIYADLHVHSRYSPPCLLKGYASQSKIDDVIKIAKKRGLRAIAITDHDVIKGSLKAVKISKKYDVVAIPSMELSSKQGHILALNITEPIKKGLDFIETIDKIHNLGGVAVCAHPLMKVLGVGKKRIKFFDGVECFNGREGKRVPKSCVKSNQFITGGSDAHTLKEVGNTVTVFSQDFKNADDAIELLRKRKSGFKAIRKTSKLKDAILPQIKNIEKYHLDLILGRTKLK